MRFSRQLQGFRVGVGVELVPEAIMRVPTGACKYQWAYILSKEKENMVDPDDVAIYLSFSANDRLTWRCV